MWSYLQSRASMCSIKLFIPYLLQDISYRATVQPPAELHHLPCSLLRQRRLYALLCKLTRAKSSSYFAALVFLSSVRKHLVLTEPYLLSEMSVINCQCGNRWTETMNMKTFMEVWHMPQQKFKFYNKIERFNNKILVTIQTIHLF